MSVGAAFLDTVFVLDPVAFAEAELSAALAAYRAAEEAARLWRHRRDEAEAMVIVDEKAVPSSIARRRVCAAWAGEVCIEARSRWALATRALAKARADEARAAERAALQQAEVES